MILTNVRIGIVVSCVLISIAFIVPLSQQARRRTISEVEMQFNNRLAEIQKWKCGTPKERLVYVGEENGTQITPGIEWDPKVAIVHRCEQSSGCCSSHPLETCKPTGSEEVSLVFKKINMLNGQLTFERLSFMNHTACECRSTMTDTNGVSGNGSSSSNSSSSSSSS